jgi:hypothetical protein
LAAYARVVDRTGAWYVYGDQKWQGQEKLKDALFANEALFAEIDTKTRAELTRMMDLSRSDEDDDDSEE